MYYLRLLRIFRWLRDSDKRSVSMTKKSKIPDRWEDYSNIGDVVPGTRCVSLAYFILSSVVNPE